MMLVIRPEQMSALDKVAQKKFRDRVADYLRQHVSEQTSIYSDTELDAKIAFWQSRSSVYGIRSERAIAKWCLLSVIAGDEFDSIQEINAYLLQESPAPDKKVDTLVTTVKVLMAKQEVNR